MKCAIFRDKKFKLKIWLWGAVNKYFIGGTVFGTGGSQLTL